MQNQHCKEVKVISKTKKHFSILQILLKHQKAKYCSLKATQNQDYFCFFG